MGAKTTDELLAEVPLFAGLSRKEIKHLSGLATRIEVAEGRELTRQGEVGREFIVVLDGTCDVLIGGKVVNTCSSGTCFGEIALLTDRRRTATVVARTPLVVDVIGRHEFKTLLEDHPPIAEQLHRAMEQRLAEDAEYLDETT